MIEFVTLASRSGGIVDPTLLEPLTAPFPRGSHFRAVHAEVRSDLEGRRLTLVRASDSQSVLSTDRTWALADGIAVGASTSGSSIDLSRALAAVLGPQATPRDVEALADDFRGNFVIGVSLSDGTLVAIGDPLGTYPFFVASTSQLHIVSNNALLIEAVLAGTADPARRSATGLGIEAVFGSGAFESTGFDSIHLVPGGHLVQVNRAGELSTKETASFGERYRSTDELSTLFDRAADQVAENVRVVTAASSTTVADLTGGVDSRLVLAALMSIGAENRVGFFCVGSHPGPDYSVSAYLQDIYRLTEARDWLPPAVISFRADPVLTTRHLLYRTMGCYSHYFHSGAGNPRDPDLLRLHGGLGGTFRSVYSRNYSGKSSDDAATYLLATRRWKRRRQYLTPTFANRLEETVRASIADRCTAGVDERDVLDQWYIDHRNRYHFGVTWRARLLQHASFHPLYSPAATAAAYSMPAADRIASRVGYEIMRRLYEPLTLLPFAEKAWPRTLTDGLPDSELHRLVRPFTPESPVVEITPGRKPLPRPTPSPSAADRPRIDAASEGGSAWQQEQLRLGRPHWTVAFDMVLPVVRDCVDGLAAASPMWDVFAHEQVIQLLTRPLGPAWTRLEMQIVYKLLAAAIWLSHDEAPSAAGDPFE